MRLSDLWTTKHRSYDPTAETYAQYAQSQKDAARNNFIKTAAIGSAGFAAGPLLGGVGAAVSKPAAELSQFGTAAGTGMGGAPILGGAAGLGSAPVKAAGSKIGLNSLLSLGQLAASGIGSIFGIHSQNNAQTKALAEQQREFDLQRQMATEQEATRKAEADRVAAESQRQWDAQQQQTMAQWRASEEQRARDNAIRDYQQQLLKEQEGRRAARRPLSDAARMKLSALIGLGR